MSDSHLSRLHTAAAVTRIEHRQQLVRYFFGMAVQPAAKDMFLTLAASTGATENAWLSDKGSAHGVRVVVSLRYYADVLSKNGGHHVNLR